MPLTYLENRHNIHNNPWTAELVELLTVLWAEGHSASQIAAKLNGAKISRSAVIGKVHRLKLPGRQPRQQPERPYLRKRRSKPPKWRPAAEKPLPPPSPTPPHMRKLTIFRLGPHHCRWPLGGLLEPPRLFCAADVREGEVYCEHHYRAARVPERKR